MPETIPECLMQSMPTIGSFEQEMTKNARPLFMKWLNDAINQNRKHDDEQISYSASVSGTFQLSCRELDTIKSYIKVKKCNLGFLEGIKAQIAFLFSDSFVADRSFTNDCSNPKTTENLLQLLKLTVVYLFATISPI